MFLYDISYSLAPVLVGFLFALFFIRKALKMKFIKHLKYISYGISLVVSGILIGTFAEPKKVGISIMVGFIVTTAIALLFKKREQQPSENIDQSKDS